jgi:hypothetical protein
MKAYNQLAAALLLGMSLTAPLVMADDHDGKKYYDKRHKDYHQWNDDEQRSYVEFRTEKHIPDHSFDKAKSTERQQYWDWKHDHQDKH